eukprot:g62859.t1
MLQREIPRDVNLRLAKIAHAAGVPVHLDTGGSVGPLDPAILPYLFLLTPNSNTLSVLTGRPTNTHREIQSACETLFARGVARVLVVLQNGSFVYATNTGELIRLSLPPGPVVDKTGSGDCFRTTFAIALVEGRPVPESLALAAISWRLSCKRKGAQSTMPTRAEVFSELQRIPPPVASVEHSASIEKDFLESVAVKPISCSELTDEVEVGRGHFGIVYKAMWRGSRVAVKRLKDPALPVAEVQREARLMALLGNHPNVITFLGACFEVPHHCLVSNLMARGSLEDLLIKRYAHANMRDPADCRMVLRFAAHASAGVLHLHSENVIHRDIASRNFLVADDNRVLVADLGLSRVLPHGQSKGYLPHERAGPLKWMAPEALHRGEYSYKTDVYMFGVTLWELFARQRPYPDLDPKEVARRVMSRFIA